MTFEELQKAGARPMTFDELKAQGATEEKPAGGEAPGAISTAIRSATNAVTSKLANPLAAGITHLVSGQPYQDALKGINETDAAGEAANPAAATTGKVVGTGLQMVAPLGGAGGSLAAKAARGALVGGTYGALSGAGEAASQGAGLGESLQSAVPGAAIGAATGGALGYGVGKLFRGAPVRVDARLVRDIARGEAGGKASKPLGEKVAELAEQEAVPAAIGEDALITRPTAHKFVGPEAEAALAERANQPIRNRPLPEPSTDITAKVSAPRTMPPEVPFTPSAQGVTPVAVAPEAGVGANRITQALDGEGVTKTVALNAGHAPGKAAEAINSALDKTETKTLGPIYKAVDAGAANPEAIAVKLRLQQAADAARSKGAAQEAAHIERYIGFLDKSYEDGSVLKASMLRKLRNEVGVGNAFPTAEEAAAQPGVQAKQAVYHAINDVIEKAADATPGVDSATLRAGNQRYATLKPLAQALEDRAAKAKTGSSTLSHAVAGGVGLAEIGNIAAHGMSTGNVLKAASEIAAVYAARHVPGMLAKAGRAADYGIAEIERAARAGGANAKLVRAIGEQIARRTGAAVGKAKLSDEATSD